MTRDKTHIDQVIRWAEFVRDNPRSVWIKHTGPLVDAQIIMANRFYARLAKTKGGAETIKKLRELRQKKQMHKNH